MKFRLPLFHKIIPQKVSIKLGLIFYVMVAALLVILGMGLTNITRKALKYEIQLHLQDIADRASGEVAIAIERPVELLEVAAQFVGRSQPASEEIQTILTELSIQFPMFENIIYVDREGKEVASSNLQYKLHDWESNVAYNTALGGEAYYSSIEVNNDFLPHATIAIPTYSLGEISGVLFADVNLRGIWKIIDNLKVGESGRAFLLDQDGRIIAHPDKQLVLKNIRIDDPFIFKNIKNKNDGIFEYQLKGNIQHLGAYTLVNTSFDIALVVQQTTEEAYQFLKEMKYLIWAMVIISLIITVVISTILARWLVRPVKNLQKWSKRVALGDFDYSLSPSSSDEIGQLFIMFKRMSERLKVAREKEHLTFLGEAAASITHRLKNSIVGLKTFSQLIPIKKNDPKFMNTFEEKFSDNVDRLETVFKNLSQVSSSQVIKREKVDMKDLLEKVHDRFRETFEQANISVHKQMDLHFPMIEGDADQLSELFVNLIQNAIQAMPGGGFLKIHATVSSDNSNVEVSITDSGKGISEEDKSKILKPFYTTKGTGMGLGLAICKKIIDHHKATLHIESALGEGTSMRVRFPHASLVFLPENVSSLLNTSAN